MNRELDKLIRRGDAATPRTNPNLVSRAARTKCREEGCGVTTRALTGYCREHYLAHGLHKHDGGTTLLPRDPEHLSPYGDNNPPLGPTS